MTRTTRGPSCACYTTTRSCPVGSTRDSGFAKQFSSPEGIKRPVSLEAENVNSIEELGSITIGEDTISCQGQPKKVGGHIVNEVLQIAQWKVVARKERFRVKDGEVEATGFHLRLPIASMGCRLHDITYGWQPPRNRCSMEAIRTLSMTKKSGFLINTNLNILPKGTVLN